MIGQMSCRTNAAPAIAACAGQNHDGRLLPVDPQNIAGHQGRISPGVFHHLKKIRAGFFHGNAINFPHLVGGDGGNLHTGFGDKMSILEAAFRNEGFENYLNNMAFRVSTRPLCSIRK